MECGASLATSSMERVACWDNPNRVPASPAEQGPGFPGGAGSGALAVGVAQGVYASGRYEDRERQRLTEELGLRRDTSHGPHHARSKVPVLER